jgi:hypothetical protein
MPKDARVCPFHHQPLQRKSVADPGNENRAWPAEQALYRTSWVCPAPGCTFAEPDDRQRLNGWGWLSLYYERLAARPEFLGLDLEAQWALLAHAVSRLDPERVDALGSLKLDVAAQSEILSWLEKMRREGA